MMIKVLQAIWNRAGPDNGQTLTEYSLVLVFVAIACVLALTTLGLTLGGWIEDFAGVLDAIPRP